MQRLWKQPNGLHFIEIDEDEKRVTVVVPPDWKLEVVPSNSSALLLERGQPFGMSPPVHMPGLPPDKLAHVSNAKAFDCVQTSPAPTLTEG